MIQVDDTRGHEFECWGVGVVVMTNTNGPVADFARFALDIASAVCRQENLPELPKRQNRERVEHSKEYVGTFQGASRKFTVVANQDRLFLEVARNDTNKGKKVDERIRLLQLRNDEFVVDHPDFARFPLVFGRDNGLVVEAFHGAEWLRNQSYEGPDSFEVPESWHRYTGHYSSHNPWMTNFRVLVRKDGLFLVSPNGTATQLFFLKNSLFAVGDENAAERIQFSAIANDKTLLAKYGGGDFYRTFTE